MDRGDDHVYAYADVGPRLPFSRDISETTVRVQRGDSLWGLCLVFVSMKLVSHHSTGVFTGMSAREKVVIDFGGKVLKSTSGSKIYL